MDGKPVLSGILWSDSLLSIVCRVLVFSREGVAGGLMGNESWCRVSMIHVVYFFVPIHF